MKSSPDDVTMQVDSNSTAWFRLKKLPAGSQPTYTLHASSVSDALQGVHISHTIDTHTLFDK